MTPLEAARHALDCLERDAPIGRDILLILARHTGEDTRALHRSGYHRAGFRVNGNKQKWLASFALLSLIDQLEAAPPRRRQRPTRRNRP